MPEPRAMPKGSSAVDDYGQSILLAKEAIERFQLRDLEPLLHAVERQTQKTELQLAVFGRFKAGKSSFLNQLLGQPLLPVGVVPVTSVVTEISYGAEDSASVFFKNGRGPRSISLNEIVGYISESENPENCKDVEIVRVSLRSLARFRGLKLVDTPGLDSIFLSNTEATLAWSPNVDLALVAVAVDPPLSQQDVALIERLKQFTPNVSILLTKVDTLDTDGQREVFSFVENGLKCKLPGPLRVFPFSIRPGYESLRERFEREYLLDALGSFQEQRVAALTRKLQTLLLSIIDYIRLALNAAEVRESDREHLRVQVLGSEHFLADRKLQFQLLAKHAAASTRPLIEQVLREKRALVQVQQKLAGRLASEFPGWRGSFAETLSQFESWLPVELERELSAISRPEAGIFQSSLRDFQRQCQETLQNFREQLSERVLRTLGTVLRTTEIEIEVQPPRAPDVSVGRIFDRNWELVSAIIPMPLVRRFVRRRFEEKVESEVFKNLSRLTSQWEEIIRGAIHATEKEAGRRFDDLVLTVRRLLSVTDADSKATLLSYTQKIEIAAHQFASPGQDGK